MPKQYRVTIHEVDNNGSPVAGARYGDTIVDGDCSLSVSHFITALERPPRTPALVIVKPDLACVANNG